jgi:hypothetical protein
MKRVMALVVIWVVALTAAAQAQILTGSVIGTVKDETGASLPGVTVTVELAGRPPVTGVTSATGEYRFTGLEAGSYTVTVTLTGFSTYKEEGLLVSLGGTTARNVTLKIGALEESVTVSGESPMVDPHRFGVTANVKREVIDVLPTRHDRIMEFGKWVPGVSSADPSGHAYDLAVLGSDTGDNTPLVDGAPQQGRGDPETVEEIQAITLGASAEYQVAQGGVFNVVSKSGTNAYRVIASAYWHPDRSPFGSTPIEQPCFCSFGETGYHMPVMRDFGGHIGGPILRDRLWFFTGGNYFHREESQPGTIPDLKPASARFNHGITWKWDWRINDKLMFKQMLFNAIWERPEGPGISQENRTGLTVAAPPETVLASGGKVYSTHSTELTATLSNNTVLTIRNTGTWNPNQYENPLSGDYTTPLRTDAGTGFSCCGVSDFNINEAFTLQQAVKINRYIQGDRTTHDLRAGVQFTRASNWSATAWPSGVQYRDLNGQPDQATFREPSVSGGKNHGQGVWVEDQISFGSRVTISVGVRFDRMKGWSPDLREYDLLLNKTGETIEGLGDMVTWSVWAPRLGGNVRLTDDGKTTMRWSAGRSYRDVSNGDFSNVHPGIAPSRLMRWDPATGDYTRLVSITDPRSNIRFDSDLDPSFTDAYSIGFDRELRANMAIGATYVHKRAEDFVGWQDIGGVYGTRTDVLPDGRTVTVFPLLSPTSQRLFLRTNAPGAYTRYNGLILTLDKRFSNRWRANVSYTRSETEGMVTTGQDPNDQVNNIGNLSPQDRPNMVVATGMYDVPVISTQVAISYMHMGGRPFAPQAQIQLPQGRRSVNIDAPGSFRYSAQNLLNFRFSKSLLTVANHRVLLNAALTNALQDTGEQSLVTRNFFAPNFAQPASWIQPRRLYFQISIR